MTPGTAEGAAQAGKSSAPRRNNAARLFGYDVFISFALGAPPRGTHSYASDLARRLRERDFTVFFSEDEAAPGDQLDSTLLKALLPLAHPGGHRQPGHAGRAALGAPGSGGVQGPSPRQTHHSDQCRWRTAGRDSGRANAAMAAIRGQDLAGRVARRGRERHCK